MKLTSKNISAHTIVVHVVAALGTLALLVMVSFNAPLAHAQQNVPASFSNPLAANTIEELLGSILKLVSRLGAIIAVLYFIYGGFLYVTAQGDENKIEKAHSTLKWAAIGTAVLLSAEIIAKVIEGTVKSISNA